MTCILTLARDDTVLVLVDMQSRLADAMTRRDAVVGTSALLARVAALLGVPVVVTRQYPAGLGDTVPEIREVLGEAPVVDKIVFSAAAEPAFREHLGSLGRGRVVLAGMETHICITQTALALASEGFGVHVVADAVCSRRDADHEVALARLRSAGVVVTTAESVIYELLEQAATPEFKVVLEVVKAHPLS